MKKIAPSISYVISLVTNHHHFVVLGLLIVWLLMIPMKAVERYCSAMAAGKPIDFPTATQSGIVGRLDDPSFWTISAALVSASLIARAVKRAPAKLCDRLPRSARYLNKSASLFIMMATFYLIAVFLKGETFAYWLRFSPIVDAIRSVLPWLRPAPVSIAVLIIQLIEGFIVLAALMAGSITMFVGLQTLRITAKACCQAKRSKQRRSPEARKCSTLLASAGVAPFSFLFLAPVIFQTWSFLLKGGEPAWTDPWHPITILPVLALFGSPFLYLSIYSLTHTRRVCTMDLTAIQFHQLVIWFALAVIARAEFDEPPRKLIFPSEIENPALRFLAQGTTFIGAFFPVAFWASAR